MDDLRSRQDTNRARLESMRQNAELFAINNATDQLFVDHSLVQQMLND